MTCQIDAFNPANMTTPFGAYHQAVTVSGASRWLLISGQLGLDAANQLTGGIEAQANQAFANIDQCLGHAGMTRANIVKLSSFLTSRALRGAYMQVRDGWVVEPWPASTLLFVPELAVEGALIEIEAIAVA